MHFSASHQYQLLTAMIDRTIQLAKKNNLETAINLLESLKKSTEMLHLAELATELSPSSKTKGSLEKVFKKTYKEIQKTLSEQLTTILGVSIEAKKLAKALKPSEKEWKQLNNGTAIDVPLLDAYVDKKLLPLLAASSKIATSSCALPPNYPGSQAFSTESSQPESKTQGTVAIPQILLPLPKSTTSSSSELRADYKRSRGLSFHPQIPLDAQLATKLSPRSPRAFPTPAQENSVEAYFELLFTNDAEKAAQFVLALTQDKEKFTWGIQVLNAASDKSHREIAETLSNNLSEQDLLAVFAELFRLEKQQNWCRGNQLIFTLLQHYLTSEKALSFREFVWSTLFSLAQPLSKIKLKQRSSMLFKPESFAAEQQDIDELQHAFAAVLKQVLFPKNFPPLMQEIIRQAYFALMQRDDLHNEADIQMRTLMVFIVLRFINPIIFAEANCRLNTNNLSCTDNSSIDTLQIWYKHTLISAIQSLTAPYSEVENKEPVQESAHVEKLLDRETLHEAIFSQVTQNQALRTTLFGMVKTELKLDELSVLNPSHNDTHIPRLDEADAINTLSEMLKSEKFSGLSFKPNGSVTPGRHGKPSIVSFFEPAPDLTATSSASSHTPSI